MKPRLLLSLPNSGSTWLADIVARRSGVRYFMEYFNPLRNPRHEQVLVRNFGCELVSCYRNIVSAGDAQIHDDIARTWGRDEFTFTKEVFSPFKLPVFVEHFQCAVLLRSSDGVFPPSRARVWSFYEHAWHALREAGHDVFERGARARAIEAHHFMRAVLYRDALRLGVPVIRYEDLFAEEIERIFSVFGHDEIARAIARDVVATRKWKAPTWHTPAS